MDADKERQILQLNKDYNKLVPDRHLVLIVEMGVATVEVVDSANKHLGTLSKRGLRGNIGVEMVKANRILESIQELL